MAQGTIPNLVLLVGELVGVVIVQQAQIAELQQDRDGQKASTDSLSSAYQSLAVRVGDLEGHAATVVGEAGLTARIGDLSAVPDLHARLTAALPDTSAESQSVQVQPDASANDTAAAPAAA